MNSNPSLKIKLNHKYSLSPLLNVDKEDISTLFKKGRGVYICNYPHEQWYKAQGFKQSKNYSIDKKEKFFGLMGEDSLILSPTQDSNISMPSKSIRIGNVYHIGSSFTGRKAQLTMFFQAIVWLAKNRKKYDYCLVYNFYPLEIFAALFVKFFLNKYVAVDFEDDYLLQSKQKFYKQYFNLVKRIPHAVICINRNMKHYFKQNKVYVFNGFIDLEYTQKIDFELREGVKMLYAGALDDIRGIDLIPMIVSALRKEINKFSILITGSGPMEDEIKNWGIEEVVFLGFIKPEEFEVVLSEADAYLVLQKPDHPFSLGSFPSKIEYYAKFKKPIYKVEISNT